MASLALHHGVTSGGSLRTTYAPRSRAQARTSASPAHVDAGSCRSKAELLCKSWRPRPNPNPTGVITASALSASPGSRNQFPNSFPTLIPPPSRHPLRRGNTQYSRPPVSTPRALAGPSPPQAPPGTAAAAAAHPHATWQHAAGPPHAHFPDGHCLDPASHWLWARLKGSVRRVVPEHADLFSWLPEPLHRSIHACEPVAVLVVRELMLGALVAALVVNTDAICRALCWAWRRAVTCKAVLTEEEYRQTCLYAAAQPVKVLILTLFSTRYMEMILPRLKMHTDLHLVVRVRQVAAVWCITQLLLVWKANVVRHLQETSKVDKARLVSVNRIASLLLVTLGMFTAAEACGVPLQSVFALGGISGLAIGLASKEVVTNFFGGLVLFLTRPFHVGDFIKVEDIGYFQTRIIGFDKFPITVPNQVFTNLVITNMSRASHRNLEAMFRLRHQDILLVDGVTARISAYLAQHPAVDLAQGAPVCYLKSLGESSLEISLSAGSAQFNAARQEIFVQAAHIIIDCGGFIGGNAPFAPYQPQPQPQPASTTGGNGTQALLQMADAAGAPMLLQT
eukprot:jgi/Mesen1/9311/ME000060S08751